MPRVEGPGYLLTVQLRGQSALSNDAGSGVGPGENATGLNVHRAPDQRSGNLSYESTEPEKARSLGYSNTTAKDATIPQIAAQSPSDRSEITIKDAPMSDGSSGPLFANGSADSPRLYTE